MEFLQRYQSESCRSEFSNLVLMKNQKKYLKDKVQKQLKKSGVSDKIWNCGLLTDYIDKLLESQPILLKSRSRVLSLPFFRDGAIFP